MKNLLQIHTINYLFSYFAIILPICAFIVKFNLINLLTFLVELKIGKKYRIFISVYTFSKQQMSFMFKFTPKRSEKSLFFIVFIILNIIIIIFMYRNHMIMMIIINIIVLIIIIINSIDRIFKRIIERICIAKWCRIV